jgi:hypothetical protein
VEGKKRLCTISRAPLSPIFLPFGGPFLCARGGKGSGEEGIVGDWQAILYKSIVGIYGRLGGTVTRCYSTIDSLLDQKCLAAWVGSLA